MLYDKPDLSASNGPWQSNMGGLPTDSRDVNAEGNSKEDRVRRVVNALFHSAGQVDQRFREELRDGSSKMVATDTFEPLRDIWWGEHRLTLGWSTPANQFSVVNHPNPQPVGFPKLRDALAMMLREVRKWQSDWAAMSEAIDDEDENVPDDPETSTAKHDKWLSAAVSKITAGANKKLRQLTKGKAEIVLDRLKQGPASLQELAHLAGGSISAATVLKQLATVGDIVFRNGQYRLTAHQAPLPGTDAFLASLGPDSFDPSWWRPTHRKRAYLFALGKYRQAAGEAFRGNEWMDFITRNEMIEPQRLGEPRFRPVISIATQGGTLDIGLSEKAPKEPWMVRILGDGFSEHDSAWKNSNDLNLKTVIRGDLERAKSNYLAQIAKAQKYRIERVLEKLIKKARAMVAFKVRDGLLQPANASDMAAIENSDWNGDLRYSPATWLSTGGQTLDVLTRHLMNSGYDVSVEVDESAYLVTESGLRMRPDQAKLLTQIANGDKIGPEQAKTVAGAEHRGLIKRTANGLEIVPGAVASPWPFTPEQEMAATLRAARTASSVLQTLSPRFSQRVTIETPTEEPVAMRDLLVLNTPGGRVRVAMHTDQRWRVNFDVRQRLQPERVIHPSELKVALKSILGQLESAWSHLNW